jgi:hypothetical protein
MTARACFFTSISSNYLSKGIAWARSVRAIYPEAAIYIFCFNYRCLPSNDLRSIQQILDLQIGGLIFLADPLQFFSDSFSASFRFNITEGCTAVKPSAALSLLREYLNVTYMDPDTILFREFEDSTLAQYDFELAPHILSPASSVCKISPRLFLQSGVFNLGYFYASRATQSIDFIRWWAEFLQSYCFDFVPQGLYVDQKPCDLAPCFIDKLHIVRHPGLNVAWWNLLSDRALLDAHGQFQVQFNNHTFPLIFFHFSNFPNLSLTRPPISKMTSKLLPGREQSFCLGNFPPVETIYRQYAAQVEDCSTMLKSLPAYNQYQCFTSGEPIWGLSRSLYREAYPRGAAWDPFTYSNFLILFKSLFVILSSMTFAGFYRSARFSVKSFLSLLSPSVTSYRPIVSTSEERFADR